MQDTDIQSNTASATIPEDIKEQRKAKRVAFINNIRASLDSVLHQFALSPTETAVAFNKSPTWAYRKIYDGTFRVISSGGRLMIPRAEIERFIARADKYDPQPKDVRGMDVPRNDEPRREPGRHQKLASAEYAVLSLIANVFGSIFWWSEERRWRIKDQLEELEWQR